MTTPESPAVPVFAPHSPATGAQVPTDPGNGRTAHSGHERTAAMKKSTADKIARQIARVVNPELLSTASVAFAVTGHLFTAWALAMLSTGLLMGAARILGSRKP